MGPIMTEKKPIILVIDDTPVNLTILSSALSLEFDVQSATSGEAGLQEAKRLAPDLILLDVMMPGMDGYEVLRRIKSDPDLMHIPVVFVTAMQESQSEVEGLKLGALDYITKPFQVEIARHRIRNLLEREDLRKQVLRQKNQLEVEASAREKSQASLALANRRYQDLLHAASGFSIISTDVNGVILVFNRGAERMLGWTAAEVVGKCSPALFQLPSAGDSNTPDVPAESTQQESGFDVLVTKAKRTEQESREQTYVRKDGSHVQVEVVVTVVRDSSGEISGYLIIAKDISERKREQELIRHMAQHDSLTGLANRALFADRLQREMLSAQRDKATLTMMFMDLDKFKEVNDLHGHAVGDLLLQEVARRAVACVRESDTVARIGGDEFVILLRDVASEQYALGVAEKIRADLQRPFFLAGKTLEMSCSIGVALYPQHGKDAMTLSKNADQAMYQAKQQGRNKVVLF